MSEKGYTPDVLMLNWSEDTPENTGTWPPDGTDQDFPAKYIERATIVFTIASSMVVNAAWNVMVSRGKREMDEPGPVARSVAAARVRPEIADKSPLLGSRDIRHHQNN